MCPCPISNGMNKTKIFIVILFVLLVSFSVFNSGFSPVPNNASAAGIFGGKISNIKYCNCPIRILFSVGPPRPAKLIYIPGVSKLYEYKRIANGVWTLGTNSGSALCKKIVKKKCIVIGSGSIVQIMGTSR